MSEYLIQGDTLTAIADAIRSKTGDTAAMTAGDMAGLIEAISGGEYEVTHGTVTHGSVSDTTAYSSTRIESGNVLIDTGLSGTPEVFMIVLGSYWQTDSQVAWFKGENMLRSATYDLNLATNTLSISLWDSYNCVLESSQTEHADCLTVSGSNIVYSNSSFALDLFGTFHWFAVGKVA